MSKKKKQKSNIVDNCEWCFQFDNDEPYVFATSKEGATEDQKKITFTLGNDSSENITFSKGDKTLKLFVRERI